MKKIFSIILILTTSVILTQCPSGGGSSSGRGGSEISQDQCQSGQIIVNGESPIYTSVSTSRMKAKTDACRRAVEKCIGEEVASDSGVSDGESIGNEIFTQAKGICRNDKILKEETYSLGSIKMLKISVRFNVNKVQLSDSIDTMKQLAGNPKAIILIHEVHNLPPKKVFGFLHPRAIATSNLKSFLIKKGYTIIDGSKITRYISNEASTAANPSSLSEKIKDAAAKAGADILILGSVVTHPQHIRTTGPFKSVNVQGVVQVHSLWGDGAVLGSYDERAAGVQVNKVGAAKFGVMKYTMGTYYPNDADEELGGLAVWLHDLLMNEWADVTRNNRIKVTITGLDNKTKALLQDDLKEGTAVKNVDEISFTNSTAVWEVTYPGRAFALADTLSFYGDSPKIFAAVRESGKKIKVVSVKRGVIKLKFQ